MSKTVLRKVGSGYVTTIPSEVVRTLHFEEGQEFEVTAENGRLVLTPLALKTDVVAKAHEKILQRYRAAFQKL